jgi:hypothetical protein
MDKHKRPPWSRRRVAALEVLVEAAGQVGGVADVEVVVFERE